MAKIAIISDTHFGFASGTEREEECYDNAQEALQKASEADIILLPGDIFDNRTPKPEVWARAMHILERPHRLEDRGVTLEKMIGKDDDISPMAMKGIPIVAIHGTHDRRGKHLLNPVQGLEAGFLIHLHMSVIVLDVRGERIAIHGMGGVPESYAKAVLERWDPKPVDDAYNIFVLHQSIDPFIYSPLEPPSLKLEDMPEGFDLYVCGHVHYPINTQVHGKPFLIPGSTVTTQTNKMEGKYRKGFYTVQTPESKVDFIEIDARRVFYEEINLKEERIEQVREIIEKTLKDISQVNTNKKPLVRLRLIGKLQKGIGMRDLDIRSITQKYEKDMILSIGEKLKRGTKQRKVKERKSIEEIGMRILNEESEKRGLKVSPPDLLASLLDDKPEGVINQIIRQKKLRTSPSS